MASAPMTPFDMDREMMRLIARMLDDEDTAEDRARFEAVKAMRRRTLFIPLPTCSGHVVNPCVHTAQRAPEPDFEAMRRQIYGKEG